MRVTGSRKTRAAPGFSGPFLPRHWTIRLVAWMTRCVGSEYLFVFPNSPGCRHPIRQELARGDQPTCHEFHRTQPDLRPPAHQAASACPDQILPGPFLQLKFQLTADSGKPSRGSNSSLCPSHCADTGNIPWHGWIRSVAAANVQSWRSVTIISDHADNKSA